MTKNANNILEMLKIGKKEYTYKALNYDNDLYKLIENNKIEEYLNELIDEEYIISYEKKEKRNVANKVVSITYIIKDVL